jgi:hypothetical protein
MTTLDFITALFCQVDDQLSGIPKHPHATLWPSEIVTLGLLHALKGGGNRAFYRWLTREVAYPLLADNVSRPLPSRLRRLTQPVMSPPNGFSAPRPPLLACL